MNKELETKLKIIADHYGLEIQSIKLAEEAAEFSASLIKRSEERRVGKECLAGV